MGEVHQDTWEARSPAHWAMSQILTQQEAAGVGGGSEELQGPFDLPASQGEDRDLEAGVGRQPGDRDGERRL